MKVTIYHNARCSKSRQCMALLNEKGIEPEVIEYIKAPITKVDMTTLLQKLGLNALDIIRKNESIWKENYKGKEMSEDELMDAMLNYPQLMERPIVTKGNNARVGRPPENVLEIV